LRSEPYFEASGQGILPLYQTPCAGCKQRQEGKCTKTRTVESQLRNQGNRLSCFEPMRVASLFENLDRYRPGMQQYSILLGLPPAIPMLCEGMPKTTLDPRLLYGIALDDLLHTNGRLKYVSGRELRAAFQLPPDGRLCLIASVKDPALEALWARSYTDGMWKQVKQLGFAFVTGMTFSVFEQQSRTGQIFNGDRNRVSVDFLAREGIAVAPVFCEIAEEDLEVAALWLEDRPQIRVVAGLAQSWKTDQQFARFLERMEYLKSHVRRPLHFLIVGCASAVHVVKLFERLGAVTVTANVALRAVKGEWWDPDLQDFVRVPQEAWDRGDMLPSSIQGFSDFCEMCERYRRERPAISA
jgi:Domain of unknown function (DUF4417)